MRSLSTFEQDLHFAADKGESGSRQVMVSTAGVWEQDQAQGGQSLEQSPVA